MRARIPVDAQGNFPINATLIATLATGVLFFNQLLFWLLAWILAGRGRDVTAHRCLLGSLVIGLVVWLILAWAQKWATGGGRLADWLIIALTGVLVGLGAAMETPACQAAGVALLIGWSARSGGAEKIS